MVPISDEREKEVKLLSVKEAADRLGISPGVVYGLCSRRLLRHERYGLGRGKIKIPEDAVDEYRQRVTVVAKPTPSTRPVKLKHLSI